MKKYDTAINPLGSISDLNIIFETIKLYQQEKDLAEVKKKFIEDDFFGIKIVSSRKRLFSVIKKLYLKDRKEDSLFIKLTASNKFSKSFKKNILFIETCRKNKLFLDINTNLIYKKDKENRRLITSSEIYDFFLEFGRGSKLDEWSESTLKTIAAKYKSFMNKIGYFEAESRMKSIFSFPHPDEELITYIVYLLKLEGKSGQEIYDSELFTALLLDESDKLDLLKDASIKGYYEFSISGGGKVEIELKFDKGGIIDALSQKKYW